MKSRKIVSVYVVASLLLLLGIAFIVSRLTAEKPGVSVFEKDIKSSSMSFIIKVVVPKNDNPDVTFMHRLEGSDKGDPEFWNYSTSKIDLNKIKSTLWIDYYEGTFETICGPGQIYQIKAYLVYGNGSDFESIESEIITVHTIKTW